MRASPAKFLFENDFTPGAGEKKPLMTLDDHAARLKAAEAAALLEDARPYEARGHAASARVLAGPSFDSHVRDVMAVIDGFIRRA